MIAKPPILARLLLTCLVLGPAGAARAERLPLEAAAPELPAVLTLKGALDVFHERGFDLLVAEASVVSAQGDLAIARAIANPGVSLSAGRNFDCSSSQDCSATPYSVGVSDSNAIFDFLTGKRGLRKQVAVSALAAARRSRDDAQRTLEFQVKQAYVAALLAQAQLRTAEETRESVGRTRELNERRYALGAINEGDLAKIQVAYLEAEQSVAQAVQGLRAAKVSLAFLLGFRTLIPDFALDPHGLDYAVPASIAAATRDSLLRDALSNRPDLRALVEQEHRADAGLSLARRSRIPDIAVSATYAANGSGETNISPPSATVGLSFTLPVFYRQRGEITKAEADLSTQRILRGKAEATVVSDLETAHALLVAAREQVERMQAKLLERAEKSLEIARVQYEKGAASLLDLLDAQRTYTATRLEYAQDLAGYWNAVAQLEEATAMDLRR